MALGDYDSPTVSSHVTKKSNSPVNKQEIISQDQSTTKSLEKSNYEETNTNQLMSKLPGRVKSTFCGESYSTKENEFRSKSKEKLNYETKEENQSISISSAGSIQNEEAKEMSSESDRVVLKLTEISLPTKITEEINANDNMRRHGTCIKDNLEINGTGSEGVPMENIETKGDNDISTLQIDSTNAQPETDMASIPRDPIPPLPNRSCDNSLITTSHFTEFEINQLLTTIGEFGNFQKVLNAILFIVCLPSIYQVLIMYFSTLTPLWRCVENSTECRSNYTYNPDDQARCTMNRTEWYYTEHKGYSLVTQFDLHCDDKWKRNLVSSIIFLGWGLGSTVIGWLGDRYGRKSVFLPSVGVALIFGFLTTFCSGIYQITACQFVIGLVIPGIQLQAFILISEFVGVKQRARSGFLITLTDPVAWCILAVKAYLIQNWKTLSMVATLPYLFIFLFYKFIPESISWLHFNGKTDRVRETARKIAKWNKKELPEHFKIVSIYDRNVGRESYKKLQTSPLDLFRKKQDAMLSIVQAFLWFVSACSYFGLHIAADDLGGSIYRDFIILNLVEIAAIFPAIICCNKIGRKITCLLPLFCSSISCIILAFLPSVGSYRVARISLGVIGKFCSSITFNSLYTWSNEIYDTSMRCKGMAWLQFISRLGSAGAPWMVKGLKPYSSWLPFFALGCPALLGSIVSIWLPETNICRKKDTKLRTQDYIAKNEHTV